MSPKPALTDEGIELYKLVSRASGIDHLAAQLSRLDPEERTRFAAVMKKEGKALKALWEKKGHEGRALLLAAHLNPTPSQLVTAMTGWALDNLSHGGGAKHLRRVVRGRGQEWGTAFVQAALKKSSVVQAAPELLNSLIDEFGLPLPETPTFWRAWVDHDPSPRPGIRWQQRFIRACQTPGAFTDDWYDEPHPGAVTEALREIEDRDEDALVAALLSVIERDDSPACQRRALWWLDHLGLADRLWDHRQALIRCLVMAERSVAKRIVEVCLRFKLEDNELSAFTFVALGRPEKGLKRQVLKELIRRRVPAHSVDTWNVQARATDPDTTTAALARQLLEQWGVDVQNPRDQRALWQEPAGREDVPTDYDAVLDPSSLAELLSRVEQLDEDDPELAERTLAALIAAAHDRGAVRIRHAIRTSLGTDLNRGPALRRLLASLARKGEEGGRVRTRKLTSQTFLVGQRISEALNALGEVPCLLSTPSHHDFRVSWEAFRDRARRYREAGAATLRIDVAVALARLDRDAVPELTEFAQPIAGLEVSLADVLTHWASHPASPGELSFAPPRPGHEHRWYLGERVRADGDAPTSHELLGLRTGWTLPFAPTSKFDLWQDELSVFSLLPEHPTRPIALALRGLGEGITVNRLAQVATTAHRLGPNGAFGLLAAASDVPAKDRSGIAYALQEAWHAGRITSDDLVTGWRHEDREVVGISPGKTIPMLVELAEGSCLALVWPLLVEIAETLVAERATATTAAALEAILQFLPEVPHPVELPNIAALAERKGSSKAIKTARLIVANMTPSPSGKAGR
ncbi:hypothetical protein [Arachnia propionica]|uniref:DUF7824 domain-containing protein n=1 Tax=Arachnia propionica TaxID=1750 RepID=A0A3P1WNT9_9ACTN|nr:hypothetical protein [Arachnia propionica]RRD48232.1 hypothetical protein EII35_13765 [Arachnia propionica]